MSHLSLFYSFGTQQIGGKKHEVKAPDHRNDVEGRKDTRSAFPERSDIFGVGDAPDLVPEQMVDLDMLSSFELNGMVKHLSPPPLAPEDSDDIVSLVSSLTTVSISIPEDLQDETSVVIIRNEGDGFEEDNVPVGQRDGDDREVEPIMDWEVVSSTPSAISFVTDPIQLRYTDMLLKGQVPALEPTNADIPQTDPRLEEPSLSSRPFPNLIKAESDVIALTDALRWWEEQKVKDFSSSSGSNNGAQKVSWWKKVA